MIQNSQDIIFKTNLYTEILVSFLTSFQIIAEKKKNVLVI
jgi:hypothetical protein